MSILTKCLVQLQTMHEAPRRAWNQPKYPNVVGVLRDGPKTVPELAKALDVSENTTRWHLRRLETDGLVAVVEHVLTSTDRGGRERFSKQYGVKQ